jgi:hypothetical protein
VDNRDPEIRRNGAENSDGIDADDDNHAKNVSVVDRVPDNDGRKTGTSQVKIFFRWSTRT